MLPKVGASLKVGNVAVLDHGAGKLYLHRKAWGLLFLTPDADGSPVTGTATRDRFHALWTELEAGADTSEARLALVAGMTPRLPCGECRREWPKTLVAHPPPVDSAESFHRWVYERRLEIALRKGKPGWEYDPSTAKVW